MTADENTTVSSSARTGHPRRVQHSGAGGTVATSPGVGSSDQDRAGKAPDGPGIGIMLSQAQIEHVIGASVRSGSPSLAALLGGLNAGQAVSRVSLEERYRPEIADGRLSHSLLRGLLVLSFLVDGSEWGVSNIAKQLEMSISTAHRYANTLLIFGLVEQDQFTRKYRLATGFVTASNRRSASKS